MDNQSVAITRNTIILSVKNFLQSALVLLNNNRAYFFPNLYQEAIASYYTHLQCDYFPQIFKNYNEIYGANLNSLKKSGARIFISSLGITTSSIIQQFVANKPVNVANPIRNKYIEFEKKVNLHLNHFFQNDAHIEYNNDASYQSCFASLTLLGGADAYNRCFGSNTKINVNYLTKLFSSYTLLQGLENFFKYSSFREDQLPIVKLNHDIILNYAYSNNPNNKEIIYSEFKKILDEKFKLMNLIYYTNQYIMTSLILPMIDEVIDFVEKDKKIPNDLKNLKAVNTITNLVATSNCPLKDAIEQIYSKANSDPNYKNMINNPSFDLNNLKSRIEKEKLLFKEISSSEIEDGEFSKN